jgi:hypothetical protein
MAIQYIPPPPSPGTIKENQLQEHREKIENLGILAVVLASIAFAMALTALIVIAIKS